VVLVRLTGKDTEGLVGALSAQLQQLPWAMIDTLTWEPGTKMADHKTFTAATDVKIYFCDPKSPCSATRARTLTGYNDGICPRKPVF
jgi:IS30 family transposase